MKYDLLIFDWDGTLVDSIPHIVESLQAAAMELGDVRPPSEACRRVIGLGLKEALEQLFGERDPEFTRRFREVYAQRFFARPLVREDFFSGVLDTLQELRGIGYPLAIATGKSEHGMRRALRALEMEDWFVGVQCADTSASKPDPLMIDRLLTARTLQPSKAILVGDTSFDLEMACNAGIDALGVAYGAHPPEILRAHRPLAVLDEFRELLGYVL